VESKREYRVKANLSKYYPVILITIVVFVMSALLTATISLTYAELELQREQETLKILQGIFPDVVGYIYYEEAEIYEVYDAKKNLTGYAFLAKGAGYQGDIIILVGIEDKETIKGITIIEHREVFNDNGEPGAAVDFELFVAQFVGLKIIDSELKMYKGQVDKVTGATFSSNAIVDIVRETALEKVKSIK
jgi:electron transport complex protein RnfG